jgi:hypothetical protein
MNNNQSSPASHHQPSIATPQSTVSPILPKSKLNIKLLSIIGGAIVLVAVIVIITVISLIPKTADDSPKSQNIEQTANSTNAQDDTQSSFLAKLDTSKFDSSLFDNKLLLGDNISIKTPFTIGELRNTSLSFTYDSDPSSSYLKTNLFDFGLQEPCNGEYGSGIHEVGIEGGPSGRTLQFAANENAGLTIRQCLEQSYWYILDSPTTGSSPVRSFINVPDEPDSMYPYAENRQIDILINAIGQPSKIMQKQLDTTYDAYYMLAYEYNNFTLTFEFLDFSASDEYKNLGSKPVDYRYYPKSAWDAHQPQLTDSNSDISSYIILSQ